MLSYIALWNCWPVFCPAGPVCGLPAALHTHMLVACGCTCMHACRWLYISWSGCTASSACVTWRKLMKWSSIFCSPPCIAWLCVKPSTFQAGTGKYVLAATNVQWTSCNLLKGDPWKGATGRTRGAMHKMTRLHKQHQLLQLCWTKLMVRISCCGVSIILDIMSEYSYSFLYSLTRQYGVRDVMIFCAHIWR